MLLAHIALSVTDLDRCIEWYKTLLDFKEIKRFKKEELEIEGSIISNGQITLELLKPFHLNKRQNPPMNLVDALKEQGLNHIALETKEIKEIYEKLISQGAVIITPIIDGRYFFCYDPDNTLIEFRQG
jgi:catechol 2,3-dioxygenase-like lactoylglutathione lyase family enzyme